MKVLSWVWWWNDVVIDSLKCLNSRNVHNLLPICSWWQTEMTLLWSWLCESHFHYASMKRDLSLRTDLCLGLKLVSHFRPSRKIHVKLYKLCSVDRFDTFVVKSSPLSYTTVRSLTLTLNRSRRLIWATLARSIRRAHLWFWNVCQQPAVEEVFRSFSYVKVLYHSVNILTTQHNRTIEIKVFHWFDSNQTMPVKSGKCREWKVKVLRI